ncbi:MAG: hypothetical protein ACPGSG_02495 [Prolixibacteraceae bacterium]|jgi:hypothetical protein
MTYRYVVYDLQKSFNASFDDADFTFNQILYWVLVVTNKLRIQQTALTNTDLFTSTFSSVAVQEDANGRKYIDLPSQIMDLPYNEGIVYITYNVETCKCEGPAFAQVHFHPTSVGAVKTLYMDEYTKPSAKNPFFYRIGQEVDKVSVNRVYLLGLECVPVEDVEIAIKTTLNPGDVCDLDANIPLPDELIQDLVMQVLQLGKYIMMMPKENTNEGEDDADPDTRMYANRAVNLPKTQTQEQ